MQKIIMFNGPPRAGKDTAGQICADLLGESLTLVKFTEVVKAEAHRRLGLVCHPMAYEDLKDTPLPAFEGMTPREFYIRTSDDMKRVHGPHVVARRLVEKLQSIETPLIVNTDVGYDFEGIALMRHVGRENTLLVRLHRTGKTFDADCRGWVDLPGVETYDVENNGSTADLRRALSPLVGTFCPQVAMALV
jgi:hypothetical protein